MAHTYQHARERGEEIMKITKRQLRRIIREGVALAIREQASDGAANQTYVAYAVVDGPSGPEGTGTAYDEEDEPIGTFKYEAVFEEPDPDVGMGATVEIIELNYTSGPHEGEEVALDRAALEGLEEDIIDELPESFFGLPRHRRPRWNQPLG
jgi:hypothetical protein